MYQGMGLIEAGRKQARISKANKKASTVKDPQGPELGSEQKTLKALSISDGSSGRRV